MAGMSGGSMLRTRRKDVNIKPNRRLDRKSSRGMIYENEELRLRTININAEVERGQTDIKKLKRENEQLRREVGALRGEYDRLERLLKARHSDELDDCEQEVANDHIITEESNSCCSECDSECCCDAMSESGTKHENGLGSCDVMPVLREEPSPIAHSPSVHSPDVIVTSNPEYFTAMVTMPLEVPIDDAACADTASIFPKTGLDILINNNHNDNGPYDDFRGFRTSPHIGFVLPPPPLDYDLDNAMVPNILMDNRNLVNYENVPGNDYFRTADLSTGYNNLDCDKDSYFVCNTKKIIQQLTVHNSNNMTTSTSSYVPSPVHEPETNVQLVDPAGPPSFKTEKSIELNYDYPSPPDERKIHVEHKLHVEPGSHYMERKEVDVSQTMQTTTEVKSTFVMFGGKKNSRKKEQPFMRSFSAPVESLTEEPVYATVKKLPKRLRQLHIKNLENEIKYIPDDETIPKAGILKDDKNKDDSMTESDKAELCRTPKPIPKSPLIRKKKRFSIHFKRKKTNSSGGAFDNPEVIDAKEDKSPQGNNNNNNNMVESSERLLELSSSWESQDNAEGGLKEDGHRRRHHRQHKNAAQECNGKQSHRCDKKRKDCDHHRKRSVSNNNNSPARSYLKNDSYQEMTTSHSERERTNSLSSSIHSAFSVNAKSTKAPSMNRREGSIPWCGCWGNSCL